MDPVVHFEMPYDDSGRTAVVSSTVSGRSPPKTATSIGISV